jgi:hypothetical protein
VSRVKKDQTTPKFYKKKHKEEENRRRSLSITKLGPSTYTPVLANTFESLSRDKSRKLSSWSHGKIDIRKGSKSKEKLPGPAHYSLINQWGSPDKRVRETSMGKVDLFERVTMSARTPGVYQ